MVQLAVGDIRFLNSFILTAQMTTADRAGRGKGNSFYLVP